MSCGLLDLDFYLTLLAIDMWIAHEASQGGCPLCGGRLHKAYYTRKPRGGPPGFHPEYKRRFSFCCAKDGCRKRLTPASVRFLGRRVYLGAVVVLVSAFRHGITPARAKQIREQFGVDLRTLKRWRKWWLTDFAASAFWKQAKGRLNPSQLTGHLPASLLLCFTGKLSDNIVSLLRFLGPITSASMPKSQAFSGI